MRGRLAALLVILAVAIHAPAHAQTCNAPAPVCKAADSVVMISSFDPIGSAVVIGDGLLVTNRHMVADNPAAKIRLSDGTEVEARVAPTDYPGDLVGLVAAGVTAPILSHNDNPTLETDLYVIGFDVGRDAVRVYAPGRLIVERATTPLARLHHDARSLPGNSGGALVDSDGRLVGIVASGGEGRNEAIAISELSRLRAATAPEKVEASQLIGRAYVRCVEALDSVRSSRGPLTDDISIQIESACLATSNRQLLDEAGKVFGTRRDLPRALKMLEASYRMDPNAPNTLISLAVTYHIAGQFRNEIPLLYRMLEFMPGDPQVLRLALQAGVWGGDQALAHRAMKTIETELPQMAPPARRFYDDPPPPPKLN
ncbi:MAG: trypsin-like peptidase domain-containing protein [Rhodospirillales bacterium]|nr:trypsin-like peptidase domain-containing protein [Rhodospirillales bacterium]